MPDVWERGVMGMKAKIKREQMLYRVEHKCALVHGGMKYRCKECGKSWFMNLEIGVEDQGKNSRPHQPCPFVIPCECGGWANDISGYLPLPSVRPILPGMKYFAYDSSGKEMACGRPSIYIGEGDIDGSDGL